MEISLSTTTVNGATVLDVRGEVDFYSAPTLRARLSEILEVGDSAVIVDLSSVGFIDSTGLGVLVGGLNLANERSRALSLVCNQERVVKLFRITGLDGVFPMFPDTASAVAAISAE